LVLTAWAPLPSLARGPQDRPAPPGPPRHVTRLPPGHREVIVRGDRFYYHGGHFYRPGPRGYFVVGAPIGAVVTTLPVGFTMLVVGGVTYYSYLGAYYQRIPAGYVVVEAPPTVVAPAPVVLAPSAPAVVQPSTPASGSVIVTAQALNVRSGPGENYQVITVVYQGASLTVQGIAPGWLYVLLSYGGYGWVAQQFTNWSVPPASG